MTIGSTAFRLWKIDYGMQLFEKLHKKGLVELITLKRGAQRIKYQNRIYLTNSFYDKMVDEVLPTKWLDLPFDNNQNYHEFLYKFYDGGITHVNEAYRGQFVENVSFIDINSSYANQMSLDQLIPYGQGVKGEKRGYNFKFYTLIVLKDITNKYGLPFLHNEYAEKREYLKTLKPGMVFKFTSISLPYFLKYYKPKKGDYELHVDMSFKSIPIKEITGNFINTFYKLKLKAEEIKDIILRYFSKTIMNSGYGKHGTKSHRKSKL